MARKNWTQKPQNLSSSESKVIWTAVLIQASVDHYLLESEFLNLVPLHAHQASKSSLQVYL